MANKYTRNEMLHHFKKPFKLSDIPWFEPELIAGQLDFANAENTVHPARLILKMFTLHCMKHEQRPIFTRSTGFHRENATKLADAAVNKLNLSLVGEYLGDYLFAGPEILFAVFGNGYLNCFSMDPELNEEIFTELEPLMFLPTPSEPNKFYQLEQNSGGYHFKDYILKERALVEENYDPEVVEKLPLLFSVCTDKDPVGRLAILEGPPGTGKTSLMRGLMNRFPDSKFCVIPPQMISRLADPAVVGAVTSFQERFPAPMVLVLEDADSVLTKRAGDNMHHISALLNMADGIMTDTLDIRVIATTNAQKSQIDEAVERPGRLGCYLQMGPLCPEQSNRIYRRLILESAPEGQKVSESLLTIPDDVMKADGLLLAEIYAYAKTKRLTELPKQKVVRKVGF